MRWCGSITTEIPWNFSVISIPIPLSSLCSGYKRLSTATNGYELLSTAINVFQRLSTAINVFEKGVVGEQT